MKATKQIFELVDQHFQPERAKDLAARLTAYYRSPGSSGYHAATDIAQRALEDAQLDACDVQEYPIEDAWEPQGGRLAVESPNRVHLTDFHSAAACLAWWSDSTDKGGELLRVVDVGRGDTDEHYRGLDVENRAVFIRGTQSRAAWRQAAAVAAKHGARGIITDYLLYQTPGVRTPRLVPQAVQLLRLRVPKEHPMWAFSISHAASQKLRDLLDEHEEVRVRASVDARTFSSTVRNVEGIIRGSERPEESLLFCAHTSGIKPGANCAEGVGLLVELSRTLKTLIDKKLIERPGRTLRFLICCEGEGSRNWIKQHADSTDDVLMAMTYCSAGHDQSSTGSSLLLCRSPDSVAGFVNDYLLHLMRMIPGEAAGPAVEDLRQLPMVRFTDYPYTPWSDNTRFASEGIAAPLIMSWPDRYFHSQLLTADKIDPAVLRRAGLLSAAAAVQLGSAGETEARAIARMIASRTRLRMAAVAAEANGDEEGFSAIKDLHFIADRGARNLRTVRQLSADGEPDDLEPLLSSLHGEIYDALQQQVDQLPGGDREPLVDDCFDVVPHKTQRDRPPRWAGLDYQQQLEVTGRLLDRRFASYFPRIVVDETWNLIDGSRTTGEIAHFISCEFGVEVPGDAVNIIVEGLRSAGFVQISDWAR